jgi:transposase-like protein
LLGQNSKLEDFMAAKAKRKVVRAAPMALMERWTAAKREAFLRALVETANVVGAARAVGVPENSPYHLRRKDDDFARAWDRALDEAYSKLEMMLLRRATYGDACDGADSPAISTTFALALLRHHQTKAKRGAPDMPRPQRGAVLRDQLIAKLAELNREPDDD